jgi:hypothetical protein
MALFVLLFLNVSVTCPRTSTGEFTFIERSIACVGDVHSTSHLSHCIVGLASRRHTRGGRRSHQVLDRSLCSCGLATSDHCFRLRDETRSWSHIYPCVQHRHSTKALPSDGRCRRCCCRWYLSMLRAQNSPFCRSWRGNAGWYNIPARTALLLKRTRSLHWEE